MPFLGEEAGILHFVQLYAMSNGPGGYRCFPISLISVAERASHTVYVPRFIGCTDPEIEYH